MQQNSLTLAREGRPSCILISWRLGVEVRGGVLLHHAFETEKRTVAWRKVSRGIHGEREDGGRASGYVFYPHSVYHLRASPSPAFRLVVKALLKPGLLTVNPEWRLLSHSRKHTYGVECVHRYVFYHFFILCSTPFPLNSLSEPNIEGLVRQICASPARTLSHASTSWKSNQSREISIRLFLSGWRAVLRRRSCCRSLCYRGPFFVFRGARLDENVLCKYLA